MEVVDQARDAFLRDNYFRFMGTFLSEQCQPNFKPLIDIDDVPDDQKPAFQRLVEQLEPSEEQVFHDTVLATWCAAWDKMPKTYLEPHYEAIKKKWLVQNYSGMIAGHISKKAAPAVVETFSFTPRVALEDLSSETERVEARAAIAAVRPHHVKLIEEAMETKLQAFVNGLPMKLPDDVVVDVRRHWLVQNYFSVVGDVLQREASPGNGADLVRSCAKTSASVSSAPVVRSAMSSVPGMFASPKKKARAIVRVDDADLQMRSVAECHTAEIGLGNCNKLQAYLLYFSPEPRWVDVRDRKTGQQERVPVLSCMVADCTGAVQADLWRQAAELYLPRFMQWSDESDDPVLLEISRFGTRAEKRRTLRTIKQLSINEQTSITRLPAPSPNSFLTPEVPICKDLIVSDFREITGSLPFMAHLSGFVTHLSGVSFSRHDVPMRTLRLQDCGGRHKTCCLHGRHSSEDDGVQDNDHVVVFFVTASEGLGSNPATLWNYESCHLIIQRRGCIVPPATQAVVLGASASSNTAA